MRIHMSRQPIEKLYDRDQARHPGFKPLGLWYGCGTEWLEWINENEPRWRGEWLYSVVLQQNANILFLSSVDDMNSFENKHRNHDAFSICSPLLKTSLMVNIDWAMVAKDYDGIEISPYQWSERLERMWYYGWDVASGCMWNIRAISKLELLQGEQIETVTSQLAARSKQ